VDVVFEKPEEFADVKDSTMNSDKDRESILGLLKEYLQEAAPKLLPEGHSLSITVTEVDMAGEFEPWHGPRFDSVRIVKDIYPPRINLSYRLTDATGAVVKEGKRELRDLSFMPNVSPISSQDSLRYEKAMLRDWLHRDFAKPRAKK